MKNGDFKEEIVSVLLQGRNSSKVVSEDEFPRHGTTLDALAKLKPCFLQVRLSQNALTMKRQKKSVWLRRAFRKTPQGGGG